MVKRVSSVALEVFFPHQNAIPENQQALNSSIHPRFVISLPKSGRIDVLCLRQGEARVDDFRWLVGSAGNERQNDQCRSQDAVCFHTMSDHRSFVAFTSLEWRSNQPQACSDDGGNPSLPLPFRKLDAHPTRPFRGNQRKPTPPAALKWTS